MDAARRRDAASKVQGTYTRALNPSAAQPDETLIKSRDRVKAHGEVFTPRWMVHQMLDLVEADLESGSDFVDKTFFEPAAGDGNFLVAILERKLRAIEERYAKSDWALESLFALASVYGVEFLDDNLVAAKANLLGVFIRFHEKNLTAVGPRTNLRRAAGFLVDSNIRRGNTLTGQGPAGDDLELSWWHRTSEGSAIVQREPFTLASLHGAQRGLFDFSIYTTYAPCRIDQVHKEVRADV